MSATLKIMATLMTVVVLATACGDDGGGGGSAVSANDPLVQAIVDDVLADSNGITADRGEAECFVTGVVGTVGKARLSELGVTETNIQNLDEIDWTDQEAESVIDDMFRCMDMAQTFVQQMDLGDLDSAQSDCVRGVFTEDVLKDFFLASFRNEDPGEGIFGLFGQLADCGLDGFGN